MVVVSGLIDSARVEQIAKSERVTVTLLPNFSRYFHPRKGVTNDTFVLLSFDCDLHITTFSRDAYNTDACERLRDVRILS